MYGQYMRARFVAQQVPSALCDLCVYDGGKTWVVCVISCFLQSAMLFANVGGQNTVSARCCTFAVTFARGGERPCVKSANGNSVTASS